VAEIYRRAAKELGKSVSEILREVLEGTGPKTSRGAHLRIRRRNPEQQLYSML
jgi:hypothetical protein